MSSILRPLCLSLLLLTTAAAPLQQRSWEETRSLAESLHEIVMLLIQKKEFAKVPEAARKIFVLDFPSNKEHLLVEEAKIFTDRLLHHSQFAVAHQVIDAAIQEIRGKGWKAQLYKEKAYLFKKEGKMDEAMKSFEIAVELEKPEP